MTNNTFGSALNTILIAINTQNTSNKARFYSYETSKIVRRNKHNHWHQREENLISQLNQFPSNWKKILKEERNSKNLTLNCSNSTLIAIQERKTSTPLTHVIKITAWLSFPFTFDCFLPIKKNDRKTRKLPRIDHASLFEPPLEG